jgi:diaminopimelate decarboxylase
MPATTQPWWSRPGLEVVDGRLHVAGRDAETLAHEHGTPLFVYDLQRIGEQARALRDAFARRNAPFTLRLAMKAQRDPAVLAYVRALGFVGIDACSPGEVRHALANNWQPDEISFTGTNVSDRDLDVLLGHGVHLNVDLLAQLERYGRRAPGTGVGIRVNPRAGVTWSGATWGDGESLYASSKPTKFGVYEEQLDGAIAIAKEHRLSIDTVHVHVGDGFLTDGLPQFEIVVDRVAAFVRRLLDAGHGVREVNAGGGIGVPQRAEDEPLDVDAYAGVLVDRLAGFGVTIAAEPGDFLVKECGVLLGQVVTVEERDGVRFVGLDTGYNVAPERFIYRSIVPIVLCRAVDAEPAGTATLAGNINEGDDLWAEDLSLPEVREDDVMAMLLVGSYNQSMHLDHCLRSPAGVLAFADRVPD